LARSRRPSSARSTSTFSLAPSDSGSRIGRADTADYDRRTRHVRPRDSREGSLSTPVSTPSLAPLPPIILQSSSEVNEIIGGLYVPDVDAEEASDDKDKKEFEQDCLSFIMGELFDQAGLAEAISKELGRFTIGLSS
jgi:hypothetical protein